jgi:hypothetical protein
LSFATVFSFLLYVPDSGGVLISFHGPSRSVGIWIHGCTGKMDIGPLVHIKVYFIRCTEKMKLKKSCKSALVVTETCSSQIEHPRPKHNLRVCVEHATSGLERDRQ